MIIDSHCHLSYKGNVENIDNVIQNANDVDVMKFLNIATDFDEFKNIVNISNKYENVYYTLGIHPHEASQTSDVIIDEIKKYIKDPKMLAIGETGLDFYYNHAEKNTQIRSLEMHIELSQETGLPLIIHMRDAEKEMTEVFNRKIKQKSFTGVIHCFTGSQKFADKMLDLNFYISASGIITFKKSDILREIFTNIPDNRLLVETDSPYLSPEPLRGKINQPSHIVHTLELLARIRNDNYESLCLKTTNNFNNLFKKEAII
ncbi:MAG: TatD family hydrolase [Pelagibacterales bacterium]|nr:TatD family hydrolase [Pelagibacterales bacterium]